MTDFNTPEEAMAYNHAINGYDSLDDLTPTEENIFKTGWFAAREYFERETEDRQPDPLAIPDGKLHALAASVQLSQFGVPAGAGDVVARAKAIEEYLSGKTADAP